MTHPESHVRYPSAIHPSPLAPLPSGHGLPYHDLAHGHHGLPFVQAGTGGQAGGGVPRKAGEVGV
jgi:hypothetical protein